MQPNVLNVQVKLNSLMQVTLNFVCIKGHRSGRSSRKIYNNELIQSFTEKYYCWNQFKKGECDVLF